MNRSKIIIFRKAKAIAIAMRWTTKSTEVDHVIKKVTSPRSQSHLERTADRYTARSRTSLNIPVGRTSLNTNSHLQGKQVAYKTQVGIYNSMFQSHPLAHLKSQSKFILNTHDLNLNPTKCLLNSNSTHQSASPMSSA